MQGFPSLGEPAHLRLLYGLLPRSFDLAPKEVRSIFDAIGTEVQITRGEHWDPRVGIQPDGLVVNVILHKSTASTWGVDEWAMGAAVGNYAYVFFPDIVRALDLNPDGCSVREPRVRRVLARAVGRVAAHEIVHIVAPSEPHVAEGLMTAVLTRRSLTRQHLHLDLETTAFVLDRLYTREKESTPVVAASPAVVASSTSNQK